MYSSSSRGSPSASAPLLPAITGRTCADAENARQFLRPPLPPRSAPLSRASEKLWAARPEARAPAEAAEGAGLQHDGDVLDAQCAPSSSDQSQQQATPKLARASPKRKLRSNSTRLEPTRSLSVGQEARKSSSATRKRSASARCKSASSKSPAPQSSSASPGKAPREAKLLFVAQFGNHSPLIRNAMRGRPGWAPGPGDPTNSLGSKGNYSDKCVKIPMSGDLPEVCLLWSQWTCRPFLDAMVGRAGCVITLNEETRLHIKAKPAGTEEEGAANVRPPIPLRLHNHLEGNGALCTKECLCQTMFQYFTSRGRDPFGALPMSFVIREGSRDPAYDTWRRTFDALVEESGQRIWLVKPGEWSNQGRGIKIYDNVEDVAARVDSKDKVWIVQKYMESPLLVYKRKFDIRAYCLVKQEQGCQVSHAFFYRDCYLRTTSKEYTTKTFDLMVHLNNDAVQKKSEDYGKFESANKLTLDDLQRDLNMSKGKDAIDVHDRIVPQIKALMADAVCASVDRLNPRNIDGCFEIFGFDFMVDSQYRVWLIEINCNPSYDLSNSYLAYLIPKMLEDTLQLTLDRAFPKSAAPAVAAVAAKSRRASDTTGTAWEHIYSSASPPQDVFCDWLPRLPARGEAGGQDVDLAELGRDIVVQRGSTRKSGCRKRSRSGAKTANAPSSASRPAEAAPATLGTEPSSLGAEAGLPRSRPPSADTSGFSGTQLD